MDVPLRTHLDSFGGSSQLQEVPTQRSGAPPLSSRLPGAPKASGDVPQPAGAPHLRVCTVGLYLPLFLFLKSECMVTRGAGGGAQVSRRRGEPRVRAAAAQGTTRGCGRSARPLARRPLPWKVAPTFPARAGLQRDANEGGVPGPRGWGREVEVGHRPHGLHGDSRGPAGARAVGLGNGLVHRPPRRARCPVLHAPGAQRAPSLTPLIWC